MTTAGAYISEVRKCEVLRNRGQIKNNDIILKGINAHASKLDDGQKIRVAPLAELVQKTRLDIVNITGQTRLENTLYINKR